MTMEKNNPQRRQVTVSGVPQTNPSSLVMRFEIVVILTHLYTSKISPVRFFLLKSSPVPPVWIKQTFWPGLIFPVRI